MTEFSRVPADTPQALRKQRQRRAVRPKEKFVILMQIRISASSGAAWVSPKEKSVILMQIRISASSGAAFLREAAN
jgi:hypothetical protein